MLIIIIRVKGDDLAMVKLGKVILRDYFPTAFGFTKARFVLCNQV